MSGSLNPFGDQPDLAALYQASGLNPLQYNPSLFPLGLFTNGTSYATPYGSQNVQATGWRNALAPDPATGQVTTPPSWAGAANPLQATQMWGQQQDANVYGTSDPARLGMLGSAGFPLWSDPRMQQDFAANTFGMTPATWSQQTFGAPMQGGGTG